MDHSLANRNGSVTAVGAFPSIDLHEGKHTAVITTYLLPSAVAPAALSHVRLRVCPFGSKTAVDKIAERLCTKVGAQADAGEVVDAKERFGEKRRVA